MAESAPPAVPPAPASPAREPAAAPSMAHRDELDAHARDDDAAVTDAGPPIGELSLTGSTPAPVATDAPAAAPTINAHHVAPEPPSAQSAVSASATEREDAWPLKSIIWPPWPSEAEHQRATSIIMQNHNGPCR